MAYIYRHIRLDTGVPFYIGIGSDIKGKHQRANEIQNRNRFWHNIVNKAGYEVEILVDDLLWDEAIKKEVEFILLHGRKEKGGLLVNLTDGGEGNVGYVTSEETKKKQSLKKMGKSPPNKGVPMSKHHLAHLISINKGRKPWNKGISPSKETTEKWRATMAIKGFINGRAHHNFGKPILEHVKKALSEANKDRPSWNKGIPMSKEQAERFRNINKGRTPWNKGKPMTAEAKQKLSASCKGKPSASKGKKMGVQQVQNIKNAVAFRKRMVFQYELSGELVRNYACAKDVAEITGLKSGSIAACCRGTFGDRKTNIHGGFVWMYA